MIINQVMIVGRIANNINEEDNIITVAITRSFKNENGEYETDFIDCTLWQLMATNTKEYCKKGDIVGVKGRIESRVYEKDDEKKYTTEVIAEKVTFLSSNSKEKEA